MARRGTTTVPSETVSKPEAHISGAAVRIVKHLVGNHPQSVHDLIQATGVTRTAVMEQLHELVAAGFATRAVEHLTGRGRPHHIYSATDAAMVLLFADSQRQAMPAIWDAVRKVGGEQLVEDIVARAGRSLAEQYARRIHATEPDKRLRELIRLMNKEGALIDLIEQPDGRLVMHKRSCPYVKMLDDEKTVCLVDLEMFSAIVGRSLQRTGCRHEGSPCCTFELASVPEKPERGRGG